MNNFEKLEGIIATQGSNGNWNYDPYMQGLYNGMVLGLHTARGDDGEVPYKDAPKYWLSKPKRSWWNRMLS